MKDTSGPAFPYVRYGQLTGDPIPVPGMTKREMIAMHLMGTWRRLFGDLVANDLVAILAIRDADALLAELEKE